MILISYFDDVVSEYITKKFHENIKYSTLDCSVGKKTLTKLLDSSETNDLLFGYKKMQNTRTCKKNSK